MQKKINVSVIIVNYKVKKQLFSLLDSIYKSKPKSSFEIIVVDNDDRDVISKDLKKIFSKVKYIKSPKNLGYGAGNNLGVLNSSGEYILVLNPDTIFHNNVIDNLYQFLKKSKNVSAVSPILLKRSGDPYIPQGSLELTPRNAIFSISFLNKIFPKNKIANKFWLTNKSYEKNREVEVLPGTCFLMKKDLFQKIGGFDEKMFLYFEENDLFKRLKKYPGKFFILPNVKLIHDLGSSTKKNSMSEEYFKRSRFYYFKKNYGLFSAILTELILRLNKTKILLILIFSLAFFLRFYKLTEFIPFIGDQGWFYLSARDILTKGEIPLVGITSSRVWLHQGAYWTYMLVPMFKLFNFHPLAPAFLTSLLDVFALVIVYKLAKKMFTEKIALIASLFYATSPSIIQDARIPYHTSPISFMTALFIYFNYKWITGRIVYFPLIILMLGILYNFEIATFSLAGLTGLFFFYGLIKKKKYVFNLFNKKTFFLSIVGLIVPLIPFLIYDLKNGFPQTVKVMIWIGYRIALFFGYPPINPNAPGETWATWLPFSVGIIKKIFFYPNAEIASIVFLLIVLFPLILMVNNLRYKRSNLNLSFIFLGFFIPTLAYIVAKTNSAAYVLKVYPQAAILVGLTFGYFYKYRIVNVLMVVAITIVCLMNAYVLVSSNYFLGVGFSKRIEASKQIINDSSNNKYNIVGIGDGSHHKSFMMGFEYILWWQGKAPSNQDEKLKFYITEYTDRIEVRRND